MCACEREKWGALPKDILVKTPYFAFFVFFFSPRDEKQISLTKHFPAYLQTGGRAGGREAGRETGAQVET